MSGNSSATGGYIVDQPPPPPSGEQITAALQQAASALSGIPGSLVRPRWQTTPPVQPPADVTWAAIGITHTEADEYPYLKHVGAVVYPGQTDPGYDIMQRHLTVTVTATFYGPQAEEAAGSLRDALYVPQNYEPLRALGLKLRTIADLARAPELINQQWIDRVDMRLEFRLQINRVYPILDLDGADVTINTDTRAETIQVREDTVLYPTP